MAGTRPYQYNFLDKSIQKGHTPEIMNTINKISQRDKLKSLVTKPSLLALCNYLHCTPDDLFNHASNPSYTFFKISKKKGGWREVCSPVNELKNIQRRLNVLFQYYYHPLKSEFAFGFVKTFSKERRDIVANATRHLNKNHILNTDIKDFFPSIKINHVKEMLESAPFNYDTELSSAIALLCCYKGALAVGSPTSPILSSFYCLSLDKEVNKLATDYNLTYTRYADDITFSSAYKIDSKVLNDLELILSKYGFGLNKKKTRLASHNQGMYVTGIKVNEHLNIDRRYIKIVRAIIHNVSRNGISHEALRYYSKHHKNYEIEKFICAVYGHLAHIKNVRGENDPVFLDLKKKWECYIRK